MSELKLLGISGALREGSFNRKLLREAARVSGAHLTEANLRLPLYDGDLEENEGIPADVQVLADQIAAADAVLIATPEYNQSFSGVLKNALDWVSRVENNPWQDKPVAIIAAAAGRAGGARAQYALRLAMTPFQPNLLTGPEVSVAQSYAEFDENGQLTNDRYLASLGEVVKRLQAAV
ncbi:NADPH-dependent FMN reductase [Cochlodiniinecator piscidefendens]|uniref:NADPH-dependent FMN reductase n=1 Tax=Cochlodiniinecator piscidefendens TaxID=2715756 RepID=UPI00140CF957|nr:NADPH-dependent FMN reductase [Cochlodiniinecator piscidefendens]